MTTLKKETLKKKQYDKDELQKQGEDQMKKSDPQEEMSGPFSSLAQGLKHEAEKNNKQSKEEADRIKDENT